MTLDETSRLVQTLLRQAPPSTFNRRPFALHQFWIEVMVTSRNLALPFTDGDLIPSSDEASMTYLGKTVEPLRVLPWLLWVLKGDAPTPTASGVQASWSGTVPEGSQPVLRTVFPLIINTKSANTELDMMRPPAKPILLARVGPHSDAPFPRDNELIHASSDGTERMVRMDEAAHLYCGQCITLRHSLRADWV